MVLVLFLLLTFIFSCKKQEDAEVLDKDASYAFGMLMANQLNGQMGIMGLHFDYQAFMEGFRDYNEANETRLTQDQAYEKIVQAVNMLQAKEDEKLWLEGERNREEGEAYMELNGRRSEVVTTPSGLQYEVILEGTGANPSLDDSVSVKYEGSLTNGTVFESTFANADPVEFTVGNVIEGWREGLQLMNEGSIFRFVIPEYLAYGSSANGPIPPSSTLIFVVQLFSINRQ